MDTHTIACIHCAETSVHKDKRRMLESPANDAAVAPRTKGIFFHDFPVLIEPLPSQKCGTALSSTNKRSPSAKACRSPRAGSGGNGSGSGGSGGGGDDPPDAGSHTDDDEEKSLDDTNLN